MHARDIVRRWQGFALVELGLSKAEFLKLTPAEWDSILHAWGRSQERHDRRTARVCMVLANSWRGTDDKLLTEDDFLPKTQEQLEEAEIDRAEEMIMLLKSKYNG